MQGEEESNERSRFRTQRLCFRPLRLRHGSQEHWRGSQRLRSRRSAIRPAAVGCESPHFRAPSAAAVTQFLPNAAAAAGYDDA
nr:hypothetical protein Iba_chr14dCG4980 [Ipomoea batatas]